MILHLSELLEFAMLFAFGFSWPFAIMRTYRAKRASELKMFIIHFSLFIFHYSFFIIHSPFAMLWLCFVYLLDMALVSTDLTLYFHYSRKNKK